jgi:predicted alpha-1,2-mannosidase
VDTHHRLQFLDGQHVLSAEVTPGPAGVEGTIRSANWAVRTVAFTLLFDRPVAETRLLPPRPGDGAPRYLLGFDLPDGVLHAKVALSTTDVAGARRNMGEAPGWDFDALARAADAEWNALLGRATIAADTRQTRIFTTALYHLFLQPNVISDVDGRYRGADGIIRTARGRATYSTFSLWDTFRAAHPLYTILVPEMVDDFVLTLLDHHKAAGYLPMWPIWGQETHCMIGNPALPVIADAWAKGFRGFDGREALAAMLSTSTNDHKLSEWSLFDVAGYYPFDKVPNEAVSRTLEAGIGDAATARMAAMLGDREAAARFGARAGNWRKLVDPETKLARGRDSRGQWRTPFDPLQTTSPLGTPGDYTEANAWQYSWTPALHDVEGLVAAMGGRAGFTAMLDRFFSLPARGDDRHQGQEGLIGQYAHGNEPSHHVAWLYSWSDRPHRVPELVREIATRFYDDTPGGITGNDDCGQMSAWYVLATLGFYPVDPVGGAYVLGRPLAARARIALPGGRSLALAAGAGEVARMNGRPLGRTVDYAELMAGGTLGWDRT